MKILLKKDNDFINEELEYLLDSGLVPGELFEIPSHTWLYDFIHGSPCPLMFSRYTKEDLADNQQIIMLEHPYSF